MFKDSEKNYSRVEKVVYSHVIMARKLRSFFQAHTIMVLSDILNQTTNMHVERSGQMQNLGVKMIEFDIKCLPQVSTNA